jgi:DnaJ-class molecular chaperone
MNTNRKFTSPSTGVTYDVCAHNTSTGVETTPNTGTMVCDDCGIVTSEFAPCDTCHGVGTIVRETPALFSGSMVRACPACSATRVRIS